MLIRRCVLAALLIGCSPGPVLRSDTMATARRDVTQGVDTGALGSDTTHATSAWPGAQGAEPAMSVESGVDDMQADQDRAITEALANMVLADENLTGVHDIMITTHDGVVTLTGNVATPRDRRRLDFDARRMAGVTRVENQVRVRP